MRRLDGRGGKNPNWISTRVIADPKPDDSSSCKNTLEERYPPELLYTATETVFKAIGTP